MGRQIVKVPKVVGEGNQCIKMVFNLKCLNQRKSFVMEVRPMEYKTAVGKLMTINH